MTKKSNAFFYLKNLKNKIKTKGRYYLASFVILGLIAASSLGGIFPYFESVKADTSAFSLSGAQSGVINDNISLTLGVGNNSDVLLGAEAHITYESNLVNITNININCPFDSCIDLSEEGIIKILGASAPLDEGGQPVSEPKTFAVINVDLLTAGTANFTFIKKDVIINDEVLSRDATPNIFVMTITEEGAVCGDGNLNANEECDDGNLIDGDGCSSECKIEDLCGNNELNEGEECDDGNKTGGDGCSAICTLEKCGNDILDVGEECDDGNLTDGDGCSSECKIEGHPAAGECGDGEIDVGEECDDGNLIDGDGCSSECQLEAAGECGDSILDVGEECDDGNLIDGDGCSAVCEIEPTCGNGIVEGSEACDDGDTTDEGTCNADCSSITSCGDGTVQSPNGQNEYEECDDGNNEDGDGCSALCQLEEKTLQRIEISIGGTQGPQVQAGQLLPLNTFAYYNIGDPENITSPPPVEYTIFNNSVPGVAIMNGSRVKGLKPGTLRVRASYGGQSDTTSTITVVSPTLPPPAPIICGNGTVEEGEECDDGNDDNTDACVECKNAVCGDGYIQVDVEECDDGNLIDGDGCSSTCMTEEAVEAVEEAIEEEFHEAAPPAEAQPVAPIVVNVPKTPPQVPIILAECRAKWESQYGQLPETFLAINNDEDGDNLTDRQECYIGTDPFDINSDNDDCRDDDDYNRVYGATDPLKDDCYFKEITEQKISITNPGSGIILRTLGEVSGITPTTTLEAEVTAYPAYYMVVNNLKEAITPLAEKQEQEMEINNIEELNGMLEKTFKALDSLNAFLANCEGENQCDKVYYKYDKNLVPISESVDTNLRDTRAQIETLEEGQILTLQSDFAATLEVIRKIDNEVIVFGADSRPFDNTYEFGTGEDQKTAFEFEVEVAAKSLHNRRQYDLVAIAKLQDNTTIQSKELIRITVDNEVSIQNPKPETIGNIPITDEIALDNLFIGKVKAENGMEIEIEEKRPIVTGSTEFASQVFAVWHSVVLASSVISDSEEGAFSIQAPRNLGKDVSHKVTLYAVKAQGDKQLRSESVDVFFRIKEVIPFPWTTALATAGVLLVLILTIILLRRRLRKRAKIGEEKEEVMEHLEEAKEAYEVSEAAPIEKPEIPETNTETTSEDAVGAQDLAPEGEGIEETPDTKAVATESVGITAQKSEVAETPPVEQNVEAMAHKEAEVMAAEVKPESETPESETPTPMSQPSEEEKVLTSVGEEK